MFYFIYSCRRTTHNIQHFCKRGSFYNCSPLLEACKMITSQPNRQNKMLSINVSAVQTNLFVLYPMYFYKAMCYIWIHLWRPFFRPSWCQIFLTESQDISKHVHIKLNRLLCGSGHRKPQNKINLFFSVLSCTCFQLIPVSHGSLNT